MAKVAFIGLGVMGYPMAGFLKTKGGHDVTVYNRNAAPATVASTIDSRPRTWRCHPHAKGSRSRFRRLSGETQEGSGHGGQHQGSRVNGAVCGVTGLAGQLRRSVSEDGGCNRARTCDPLIKSQLLYQLSYTPGSRKRARIAAGRSTIKRPPPCPV